MVLDEITLPRIDSHRILPLSASNARNRRFRSPKKMRSPAVASTAPLVGTFPRTQRCTSPVDRLTFASPFRLFGSAPGRGVPTRRSGVPGLPSAAGRAAVMSRQLSIYGTYSEFLPGWYAVGHQLRVLNAQTV